MPFFIAKFFIGKFSFLRKIFMKNRIFLCTIILLGLFNSNQSMQKDLDSSYDDKQIAPPLTAIFGSSIAPHRYAVFGSSKIDFQSDKIPVMGYDCARNGAHETVIGYMDNPFKILLSTSTLFAMEETDRKADETNIQDDTITVSFKVKIDDLVVPLELACKITDALTSPALTRKLLNILKKQTEQID